MEPNLDALKQELLAEFDRVGEMLAAEGCHEDVAVEFTSIGRDYLLWWKKKWVGIGGSPDYFISGRAYDLRVLIDAALAIGKLIDKARAEKVTAEKMQAAIDHMKHLRGEPRVVGFVDASFSFYPSDMSGLTTAASQVFPTMTIDNWIKIAALVHDHGSDWGSASAYFRAAELAFPNIKFVPAEEVSK